MPKSINDVKKFAKFASKELGIDKVPDIAYTGHEQDKDKTFGAYDGSKIKVRVAGRQPLDIMRTVAHELAHHKQKLKGVKGDNKAGGKTENDANAKAGEIMRKYDSKNSAAFKDKPIAEDGEGGAFAGVSTNAMGGSSSKAGTGGIDTFDPLLMKKKLRTIVKRKTLGELKK